MIIDPRQEWETPSDLFGVLDREFGFDLDVCATAANTKHPVFISPSCNALKKNMPWLFLKSRGWLNPGFANPMPWCEKAHTEVQRDPTNLVVQIGLVSVSAAWWRFACTHASEIRLLSPRPQFVAPPGIKQTSNPRESVIIVWRKKTEVNPPPAYIWSWRWKD